MTKELSARYDPQSVEPRWIEVWARDVNRADARSAAARAGRRFVVMIPPPNVTGALHMGHALNDTLQDVLVRFHRMQGFETLWLPGTDHAGIATQAVVEKKLIEERNVTREQLGREAFEAEVWAWRETYGTRILEQLRRLGSSCDWSRLKFTLDPDMARAVREAFVRLWERGLVYHGARLVNWDCRLRTAVSDDEIEYVTQKGRLWRIRYPVAGEPGRFVTIATTRPETMLGDTGVAVHPEDERWSGLVGRKLVLPLLGREIPVVADETVERGFGTGAVKITPGHDPADHERGRRFGLPIVSILAPDGRISAEGGRFAGMSREKARQEVVAALEAEGLVDGVTDIEHNVAVSDRSKTAIEPLVSEQWFVRMEPLAGPAIRAVRSVDGAPPRLRLVPERWTKVYLDWLTNVRDWCISRQLWWGHRIPVWYDEDGVPAASREDLPIGSPHPITGKPVVRQDEDVLDTWASSWLWPFATLGWPERTEDLEVFYPTQFLATSREIIYLWVARMVMAGYEFLDHLPADRRCPFDVVYIHATILDAQGRRMSKSLGNGIDPMDVIAQVGADALRFTLVHLTTEGQDVKLDPKRFEMGRNFMNKLWNAARFVQTRALEGSWRFERIDGVRRVVRGDLAHPAAESACADGAGAANAVAAARAAGLTAYEPELEDRWIRAEFARAHRRVTESLRAHRFNEAADAIYAFAWDTFCDWYVELVKPRLESGAASADAARDTLIHVLAGTCRMLHPIAPHVTEELWETLRPWHGDLRHLAQSDWGEESFADAAACAEVALLQDVVRAVRNLRKESGVSDKEKVDVLVVPHGDQAATAEALRPHAEKMERLALASSVRIERGAAPPAANASQVLAAADVFIDLAGKIDVAAERERLGREIAKAEQALAQVRGKLANEGFVSRAKPEVVQAERERAAEAEARLARLRRLLANLGG